MSTAPKPQISLYKLFIEGGATAQNETISALSEERLFEACTNDILELVEEAISVGRTDIISHMLRDLLPLFFRVIWHRGADQAILNFRHAIVLKAQEKLSSAGVPEDEKTKIRSILHALTNT